MMFHALMLACACIASRKSLSAASADLGSACLQADSRSPLDGLCFSDHVIGSLGSLQLLQTKSEIHRERGFNGVAIAPPEHAVEKKSQVQPMPVAEKIQQFTPSVLSVATESFVKGIPAVTDIIQKSLQDARQRSAADATGAKANEVGDLDILFCALVFNSLLSAAFLGMFILMKSVVPVKYDGNIRSGVVDKVVPEIQKPEGYFGWFHASLALTTEQVQDCAGLDNAMLLEFSILGMKICLGISIPVVMIMSPLNFLFGGGRPEANDLLEQFSIQNVADNNRLYWVYALLVWGIVFWTIYCLNQAQASFWTRRRKWLKDLPIIRATTLFVENIPREHRSDAKLEEFFERMFPGTVQSAYVVRQTRSLLQLIEKRKEASMAIKKAEEQLAKDGQTPDTTPHVLTPRGRTSTPSIEHYEKIKMEADDSIRIERSRILTASAGSDVYTDKGFVRFKNQRALLIAQNVHYTSDDEQWEISIAPPAEDIRWRDLQLSKSYDDFKSVMGYTCLALVFIGFTPGAFLCENIAILIYVGPWQPLWISLGPVMALHLFMSFLPMCFATIFRAFFALKSDTWAQLSIQNWYWWFMLFFIVMVTAIGTTVVHFAAQITESPYSLFPTLAYTLPEYTCFYWCFFIGQWFVFAWVLLRAQNVGRYLFYKIILRKEDADKISEPEDQAYDGIGARSARFSIYLVIAIVFCTLSPLMCLLGALGFGMCRISYGFLVVFAEIPKPDLGGAFWVQKLHHCFMALYIYVSLMLGVLFTRCGWGPCLVVLPCFLYVTWSWREFVITHKWEVLPFEEAVVEEEEKRKYGKPEEHVDMKQVRYEQRELFDDDTDQVDDQPRNAIGGRDQ